MTRKHSETLDVYEAEKTVIWSNMIVDDGARSVVCVHIRNEICKNGWTGHSAVWERLE